MEKNIIKNAKKYVNKLLFPLNSHYYHSYEHALDVMYRATYLAEKEGLKSDEIEIMALAGLFHDTGFVVKYDKNEPIGAKIARNFLKSVGYPEEKIVLIEYIILATDPDYKHPKNIYEKIIKDSDMDNLGRDDFSEKANRIKKELETVKKIKIKDPDWNHALIQLLKDHKFNTHIQKDERDRKKHENLNNILETVESEHRQLGKKLHIYN